MRVHCISSHHRSNDDIIDWHYGPPDENASIVNGLLCTSPARTICDCARDDSAESLLVSINHCLYKKLFTKEELLAEMNKHPRLPGTTALRNLLYFATEKCESPLETIAWTALYKAKFVMPTQQIRIYDGPKIVARVDMYWELTNRRVILELDGKMKYQTTNDLYKEKRREDALRAMGFEVVRAVWADVVSGALVKRLHEINIPQRRYYGRIFPRWNVAGENPEEPD